MFWHCCTTGNSNKDCLTGTGSHDNVKQSVLFGSVPSGKPHVQFDSRFANLKHVCPSTNTFSVRSLKKLCESFCNASLSLGSAISVSHCCSVPVSSLFQFSRTDVETHVRCWSSPLCVWHVTVVHVSNGPGILSNVANAPRSTDAALRQTYKRSDTRWSWAKCV